MLTALKFLTISLTEWSVLGEYPIVQPQNACIETNEVERMKKESIYAYPAVFKKEKSGLFSVVFPDIEGCYTSGDDLLHALIMARDVLALMINTNYEEKDIEVPESTPIEEIKLGTDEFVSYVVCDTKSYCAG